MAEAESDFDAADMRHERTEHPAPACEVLRGIVEHAGYGLEIEDVAREIDLESLGAEAFGYVCQGGQWWARLGTVVVTTPFHNQTRASYRIDDRGVPVDLIPQLARQIGERLRAVVAGCVSALPTMLHTVMY